MNDKLSPEEKNDLFDAILSLKDRSECEAFFDDLCTVMELKSMSQRFQVAKMLKDQHVFSEIAAKTGASTTTISRVNKALHYGSEGYNLVLERMVDKNEK